jgi:hypothetical protein
VPLYAYGAISGRTVDTASRIVSPDICEHGGGGGARTVCERNNSRQGRRADDFASRQCIPVSVRVQAAHLRVRRRDKSNTGRHGAALATVDPARRMPDR